MLCTRETEHMYYLSVFRVVLVCCVQEKLNICTNSVFRVDLVCCVQEKLNMSCMKTIPSLNHGYSGINIIYCINYFAYQRVYVHQFSTIKDPLWIYITHIQIQKWNFIYLYRKSSPKRWLKRCTLYKPQINHLSHRIPLHHYKFLL